MHLSFLGNAYEASNTPVESIETEHTASFLGKKYKVHKHVVHQRTEPSAMKYRGVRYTG